MGFGPSSTPGAGTSPDAKKAVTKILGNTNGWTGISGTPLACKTNLKLNCLKNLGNAPISADEKSLLGLTMIPTEPILKSLTKGCARLIASGRLAKQDGKAEFEVLMQAIAATQPALGKKIAQAAKGNENVLVFSTTTRMQIDRALASLPPRVSDAIKSLESPNKSTLDTVVRFFRPEEKVDPFLDLSEPEKVARSLRAALRAAERRFGFISQRDPFVRYSKALNLKALDNEFSDIGVVAVAFKNNIYIHQDRFSSFNDITRAAVVLHEILHDSLSAAASQEDFRYIWQGVEGLSAEVALKNADSFVAFVFHDVLSSIGRYEVPRIE